MNQLIAPAFTVDPKTDEKNYGMPGTASRPSDRVRRPPRGTSPRGASRDRRNEEVMSHRCQRFSARVDYPDVPDCAWPNQVVRSADTDVWGRVRVTHLCCGAADVEFHENAVDGQGEPGVHTLPLDQLVGSGERPGDRVPRNYPLPPKSRVRQSRYGSTGQYLQGAIEARGEDAVRRETDAIPGEHARAGRHQQIDRVLAEMRMQNPSD